MLYLGLYLRRLSTFPQQTQQIQQKIPVARARCVMYYGQPFAWNETKPKPDVAQNGTEITRFVVRTINVNFLLTSTVRTSALF